MMSKYEKFLKEIEDDLSKRKTKFSSWSLEYFRNHKTRYISDTKLFEHYYKKAKIFEIGSVPCHLTALLKKLGYPIIGSDKIPDRVKELPERFAVPTGCLLGVPSHFMFEQVENRPAMRLCKFYQPGIPVAVSIQDTPHKQIQMIRKLIGPGIQTTMLEWFPGSSVT